MKPIDPAYEAALASPVIVAAGRLADVKNYPLLIEAVAVLRARVPVRLLDPRQRRPRVLAARARLAEAAQPGGDVCRFPEQSLEVHRPGRRVCA